jgi:hypothetical protein
MIFRSFRVFIGANFPVKIQKGRVKGQKKKNFGVNYDFRPRKVQSIFLNNLPSAPHIGHLPGGARSTVFPQQGQT